MSDTELEALTHCSNTIRRRDVPHLNISVAEAERGCHRFDIPLESKCSSFWLRGRQAVDDPGDYSAILSVRSHGVPEFHLIRCNGAHDHMNRLEREMVRGTHVHIATERYINMCGKAEGYAIATDRYYDFESALEYLIKYANIKTEGDDTQPLLF